MNIILIACKILPVYRTSTVKYLRILSCLYSVLLTQMYENALHFQFAFACGTEVLILNLLVVLVERIFIKKLQKIFETLEKMFSNQFKVTPNWFSNLIREGGLENEIQLGKMIIYNEVKIRNYR